MSEENKDIDGIEEKLESSEPQGVLKYFQNKFSLNEDEDE